MKRKICIISMKTWGEFGNFLAGQTLAAFLADAFNDINVELVCAEDLCPVFSDLGRDIREATYSAVTPDERTVRYGMVMERAASLFRDGFENDPDAIVPAKSEFQAMLLRSNPTVVVGTKGLLSRLCFAAVRESGLQASVVNYVTNHGLLELAIHRTRAPISSLVQLEVARQEAIHTHGFASAAVRHVGRLLSLERSGHCDLGGEPLEEASNAQPRILIFCNRGDDTYLSLLHYLSAQHADTPVVFIAPGSPAMRMDAIKIMEQHGARGWKVLEALNTAQYSSVLEWLTRSEFPILISKTGPNAMLEGAWFGIPQLLLKSGLPMERWVGPFVEEHRFGQAFDSMDQLVGALNVWLNAPAVIAERRQAALSFGSRCLDPKWSAQATRTCFDEILTSAWPHQNVPASKIREQMHAQ